MHNIKQLQYQTGGGITVRRSSYNLDYLTAIDRLTDQLDSHRGVLLASSFEYPGRYTRWDLGFINPPLELSSRGLQMQIRALNNRGEILLPELFSALQGNVDIADIEFTFSAISLQIRATDEVSQEELRSRRPSVLSVLRSIVALFRSGEDPYLGLYGAFGYDLGFQFEDVERHQSRSDSDRDLVLYLPDQIVVADHRTEEAISFNYEFVCRSWKSASRTETTGGFRRTGEELMFSPGNTVSTGCDHQAGEYAACVEKALAEFRLGNLFEAVPGQVFFEPCKSSPAQIFRRLKASNPAPYGALINLGEQEYLVAASPEMFVRVENNQIETCPISGTIKRGVDAIGDAEQIRRLLNSRKDESELSMCTDVDRNDKARVCVPGSVKVIGRRQIEMYSRLIHTVDHVIGELDQAYDALDGFLAHTWAVT
ncbi:MAG: chorismate-binding protein, partial [Pseudohongiellaceae bacterium]